MTYPTFLDPPTHYNIPEFRAHLSTLDVGDWRPRFPTLHNTGVPSLTQWLKLGSTPQERWGANLNRYYQGMGWHAGPHLVVCPDYVWVLCDLRRSGVSVSCWNSETFGIEMVGNFEVGGDDFHSGEGAKVRDNAVSTLAILAERFGWDDLSAFELGSRGLHFHRECAQDRHACPGSRVSKSDLLDRVHAIKPKQGFHDDPKASSLDPGAPETRVTPSDELPPLLRISDIQRALKRLGFAPTLVSDGLLGPATIAAIKDFQRSNNLAVDGWAGPRTCSRMRTLLTR